MNWLLWNRGRLMEEAGGDGGGSGGGGDGGAGGSGAAGGATLLGGASGGDGGGSFTPPPVSWVKDDGSFSEGWLDRLPDDLKGHASLKVLPSLTDLAKSYVQTKSMVGKRLEAPGENATPEQLTEWRKVLASMTKGVQQNAEAQAAHLTAETAKLKQTWGNEFDSNLGLASKAAKVAGLDPATNPIFGSAEVVEAFAKLGRMFNETSLVTGETASASGSIVSRITEIQDPKSTAIVAREYRGEFGPERQASAQAALQSLIKAKEQTK